MTAHFSKAQWAELRAQSTEALPSVIAKVGLPKALLPYQARAISLLESSACQVLFIEKSRRIGLTWGFASYAVLRAARAKSAGGMDVMYISYSQEMTREFIDACAMWARAFSMAAIELDEFLFDDSDKDGERSIQAFRIKFASGFEIVGLSSAPRSLRGKQGVVMIDEAAFVDSLKELLKAALAFLMWGGQVVVCSTHNGVDNYFNSQIQDTLAGRTGYDHIRIDIDQALQDGLYQRICLVTGKEWTPELEADWRESIIKSYGDGADEELFCIPTMGSGTWLSGPLIEARMTSDAPIIRIELPADFLHRNRIERALLLVGKLAEVATAVKNLDPNRRHAFGFDFARVADLSVAKLLSINSVLKRESALTVEMRNVPGDEQKLIVRMILQGAPNLVGAAFDATGMGWIVAEDMGRIFGISDKDHPGGLVQAIKFSQEWYRINMPPLKAAFEDDAIAISKDDAHLSDLRLVKVIRGIPMVPDARTGEGSKKRHGDYAVALALAHYASRQQWYEYAYIPIGDLDDDDFSDRDRRDDQSSFGREGLW
jgi:phage FluMu gp28-like protein